jgi:GNAT superfamily N-acetyltransferase
MDESFILPDGTRLAIRPILSRDAPGLHALLGRLSLHTICNRFLVVRRALRDEEAERLATVDYRNRMALVALEGPAAAQAVAASGGEGEGVAAREPRTAVRADADKIVAVARYDVEPGKLWTAEAALVVEDRLQGHGLGTYLCRRLVNHARMNGVSIFTASVYASNHRMLRMIQRSGYPVSRRSRCGVVELSVSLDL